MSDAVATIAWGPVCALTLLITAGVALGTVRLDGAADSITSAASADGRKMTLDATLVMAMMRDLRPMDIITMD